VGQSIKEEEKMKVLKKLMFTMVLLLNLIVFAFILTPVAQAHPPASVELFYNMEKQILEVKITHASSNLDKHYVKKVVIKKNGEAVGGSDYTNQPEKELFIYTYTLVVAPGDLLEVKATCSVFGSKIAEFKIEK
jgi:hypothetical protein